MDQTFMKEKKILPLVLSMALPMIISMAVNSLYNIIDSFFVAKVSENSKSCQFYRSLIWCRHKCGSCIPSRCGRNAERRQSNNLRIVSKLYTRTYTYRLFNIRYAVLRKNVHNRYRCYQSCRNVLNYRVFIFNNSKCRHSI